MSPELTAACVRSFGLLTSAVFRQRLIHRRLLFGRPRIRVSDAGLHQPAFLADFHVREFPDASVDAADLILTHLVVVLDLALFGVDLAGFGPAFFLNPQFIQDVHPPRSEVLLVGEFPFLVGLLDHLAADAASHPDQSERSHQTPPAMPARPGCSG
jgi:hypothetical protein